MIEKLFIRNYLIIQEAEIDFNKGLNILTGETGAGKSIILDALSLILGERADYSIIRKDQDKLIVEGQFNLKKNKEIKSLLKELFKDEEIDPGSIIIRRELLKKGTGRNFINDSPVNISDMKKLGDMIIDIHSQNEHQSLLNKETHTEIIDDYCGNEKLFIEYEKIFNELKNSVVKYQDLCGKKDNMIARRSFIEHELKEINNLGLRENEDVEMEIELTKLENVEEISLALETAIKYLYEEDSNALITINYALKEIKKISGFDDDLKKVESDIESSYILVKENAEFLSSYKDKLNFDSNKTENFRNRLSEINHLKKKYGLTLEQLIAKAETLKQELLFAENFDYELEQIKKSINDKKETAYKLANDVFELRKVKSKELEKKINLVLNEVGLENSEFRVDLEIVKSEKEDFFTYKKGKEYLKLSSRGFNEIEFIIKINKGTDYAPLQKSASGGEISRIMLAIKAVLAEKDKIGILVFDEIDAGISGKTANKVGKILKKLASTHQVICITHLPQIAAMSERHFHVSKKEEKDRTIAEIKHLSEEEKIIEIAKLISGEKVTDASTNSAIELINS